MILVTGASGFVGQHLVQYLSAQGKPVRALYNSHPPKDELLLLPNISWMQCDLLDVYAVEAAMEGIEDIYHCAAVVSFAPGDKQRMLHFNVEATANIVNEAIARNVRKILYVSSIASLGRNAAGKEITEEEEWQESKHNSIYSLSKYNAELEIWRGIGEGLDAVIINPGIILGEGNWDEGSARLIKVVYNEFPFYTEGINGWVDVKDVVALAHRLMNSDISAERFIVSAGNFSYKDIFTRMAEAMGRKPPYIKANALMTGIVWRWNWLRNRLFGSKITVTKETARTANHLNYYNNNKLFSFLPGFQYTPMQDTINRMATSFLSFNDIKN